MEPKKLSPDSPLPNTPEEEREFEQFEEELLRLCREYGLTELDAEPPQDTTRTVVTFVPPSRFRKQDEPLRDPPQA